MFIMVTYKILFNFSTSNGTRRSTTQTFQVGTVSDKQLVDQQMVKSAVPTAIRLITSNSNKINSLECHQKHATMTLE